MKNKQTNYLLASEELETGILQIPNVVFFGSLVGDNQIYIYNVLGRQAGDAGRADVLNSQRASAQRRLDALGDQDKGRAPFRIRLDHLHRARNPV